MSERFGVLGLGRGECLKVTISSSSCKLLRFELVQSISHTCNETALVAEEAS